MRASAGLILDAYLDDVLKERGLTEADLALVGFSQGTMMALHVGLRRANPVAGIVGYSGMLVAPELLGVEIKSQAAGSPGPRHGRRGPALRPWPRREAGPESQWRARPCRRPPGPPHSIDQRGPELGGSMLHQLMRSITTTATITRARQPPLLNRHSPSELPSLPGLGPGIHELLIATQKEVVDSPPLRDEG